MKKYTYYVDIGKSTPSSTSYLRVHLKRKKDNDLPVHDSADDYYYESNGRILQFHLVNFYIKFYKSRNKGLVIREYPDTTFQKLLIDFKGGTSYDDTDKDWKLETLTQLYGKVVEWFERPERIQGTTADDMFMVDDPNIPWYFEPEIFGNASDLIPYGINADNGSPHFNNPFRFTEFEEDEYLETAVWAADLERLGPLPDLPDPVEGVSNFSNLQTDICIKAPSEEEPENPNPNLYRVCPTCIPNPYFVPPDWTTFNNGEVWLNELTCEYTVSLVINEVFYSDYLNKDPTSIKNGVFPQAKRDALFLILSEFNKIISDNDICANPPNSSAESCQDIDYDLIEAYTISSIIPSGQGDGTTQTVYSLNPEIYEQIEIQNPNALELYTRVESYGPSKYSSGLVPANDAKLRLKIVTPANLIDVITSDSNNEESDETQSDEIADNIIFQAKDIQDYFDKKLPNVYKTFSEYQAFYKQTENGRIKIATPSGFKPFYLRHYIAHFKEFHDDFKQLLKKNGYRLPTRSFPNKLRLAKEVKIVFEEIEGKIAIKKVLARYEGCPFRICRKGINTFKNNYNVPSKEVLLNYISRSNDMVKDIEKAKIAPPWKEFASKYTTPQIVFLNTQENPEADSCIDDDQERIFEDLLLDSEVSFSKAIEYACNSLNCRSLETWDETEYEKTINKLTGVASNQFTDIKKTYADYNALVQRGTLDSGMKKYFSNLITKSNVEEPFFNRLVGMSMVEMRRKMKTNPDQAFGILFDKMNPCNWESLTLDLLKCMLKGLNPVDSLKKLAKSLISGLDVMSFEDMFLGLPIETQNELTEEIRKIIGDLELPWEYQRKKDKESKKDLNAYEEERNEEDSPKNPATSDLSDEEVEEILEESNELAEEKQQIDEQVQNLINENEDYESEIMEIESYVALQNYAFVDSILQEGSASSVEEYIELRLIVIKKNQIDIKELQDQKQTVESEFIKSSNTASKKLEMAVLNKDVNVYEKAFRQVSKLIIEAYSDLIVEKLQYNELKNLIDNIPGSNIFAPVVAAAECATTSFTDSWLTAAINNVELNPCRGKYGWTLPEISKLPEFNFLYILKMFLAKFLEKLIPKLLAALMSYITRTFEKILALTCDLFEGLGRHLIGNDSTTLFDAIADAFCNREDFTPFSNSLPQAGGRQRDSENTLNDIFSRYGAEVPRATARKWVKKISQNVNSNQFKEIFLGGDSTGALEAVWLATEEFDDDLISGIFTSIEDIQNFFNLIGATLTGPQKEALESYLDQLVIIADENESVIEVCERLCKQSDQSNGIEFDSAPFDDSDLVDQYVGGFLNDFGDILSALQNGPDDGIINAIDETIDPFSGGDPFCSDLNDPDNPFNVSGKMSILEEVPQELKDFRKTVSESVIADFEIAYQYDLIGSPNSYFNNVLADKNHARLSRGTLFNPSHEFRAKTKFLFPNAADTKRDQKQKWKNAIPFGPLRLTMRIADNLRDFASDEEGENGFFDRLERAFDSDGHPSATNIYPKSVGSWLYEQILTNKDASYRTNLTISQKNYNYTSKSVNKFWNSLGFMSRNVKTTGPVVKKPDYSLKYRDYNNNEGPTWGFNLEYNNDVFYLDESQNQKKVYFIKNSVNPMYQINYIEDDYNNFRYDSIEDWFADLFPGLNENKGTKNSELVWQLNVPLPLGNYNNVLETLRGEFGTPINMTVADSDGIKIVAPHHSAPHKYFYDFLKTSDYFRELQRVDFLQFNTNLGMGQEIDYQNRLNSEDLYRNMFNRISEQFFNNFTSKLFSSVSTKPGADDQPNGFKFGYKFKTKVTFADLLYVNPEATSDESTWKYTYNNEDKVLGKSATDNPRVMFLDPEIYGGSYKKPKIYVRPADHTGWLGYMQTFLPEDDGCAPRKEEWLFASQISKRINEIENKITKDKRLSYDPDCIIHPPYDLIADSSTHAYVDGIVILTIRAYIVELLLRTIPIISNLRFTSKNYDTGMGLFLINNMELEMKDTPNNAFGGMISKRNYWYIFLEQMVQSVERKILFGEIEKDENLNQLFAQVKQAKKSYVQPSRRDYVLFRDKIKNINFDSNGDIIKNSIRDSYNQTVEIEEQYFQNKIKPFLEAVAFNAFGENFKQYLKNQTSFIFSFWPNITLKKLKFYTKVYSIYKSEEAAKEISSYLILNEFNYYRDKVSENFSETPYIEDVSKFVLNPKSGMSIGLPIETGTYIGESRDFVSNREYGDVIEISDNPEVSNPLEQILGSDFANQMFTEAADYGKFFLEKYVIVYPKPDLTPSEIIEEFARNDDPVDGSIQSYLGFPMSVSKFKEIMTTIRSKYNFEEGTHISDYFGLAKVTEDGESYTGSIGFKFGVRLSYLTPKGFSYENVATLGNLFERRRFNKKTYRFPTFGGVAFPAVNTDVIPLMQFEEDFPDKTMAEFYNDFAYDNLNIPIKCYIDKICEMEEYKFLMEFCFPTKRIPTLNTIYSYYGFLDSIGEHTKERDQNALDIKSERWKEKVMGTTKRKAYLLFKKFYKSLDFDNSEPSDKKHKKENKKKLIPSIDLNLTNSIKWSQRRRFHERPFNKDGKECLDGALGAFNQLSVSEQPTIEDKRIKRDNFAEDDEGVAVVLPTNLGEEDRASFFDDDGEQTTAYNPVAAHDSSTSALKKKF